MSDHHYHSNNSGFLNGFLLGAILGAGIVFFLGTKRGKELAKDISEKGLSAFEGFDDLLDELGEETQPPTIPPPVSHNQTLSDLSSTNGKGNGNGGSQLPTHIETLQTAGRRLFHGIPKRR